MNFEKCELYKVKRKRDLYKILRTTQKEVVLILNAYKACINEENRLLEKPTQNLKRLQRKLLNKLYTIDFPNYVFSGIKGKSAQGNALQHLSSKYMLKLDMSKFFPNTHRNKVYNFFLNKLRMAPDVAKLCTDITTINYRERLIKVDEGVYEYMKEKKIKNKNHLPSGTPTSQILSYLANLDMFDEIIGYCKAHNLTYSIYVDDITLSTNRKISFKEEKEIKAIIKKHGQKISKGKTIRYNENEYKKITGFVISPKHQLVVANKTRLKIKQKLSQIKDIEKVDVGIKNSLLGLTNFTQLVQKNAYRGLKTKLKQRSLAS